MKKNFVTSSHHFLAIMLQHVESEEFLMCSKSNSLGYKVAYKATLDHWYSRKLIMKIHSKFKSRTNGDVVQTGDEILLESTKSEYYLDVANDVPYYLNNFQVDLNKDKYRKDISYREIRAKKYSAIFSNNSRVSWRFMLFQKFDSNKKRINGHDLIRITHTELGGSLCSALRYKSTAPEVYIRNYQGKIDDEHQSLSCIWEIQHVSSQYLGDDLKLVINQPDENEELQDETAGSEPIKLKHFLSEKYLFAVPFKEDYLMVVSNHTLKVQKKNYVKLHLTPVFSNTKHILDGKTFSLRSKGKSYSFG